MDRATRERRTPRRRSSILANKPLVPILVLLLTASSFVGTPTAGASAPAGFVSRNGTQLTLDGQPYEFTGINIYNINSDGWCGPDMRTGQTLDDALTAIGPGMEVIRGWFFQGSAIDWTTGTRDWTAFDHALDVADAHGLKVIPTLTDQWGECGTHVNDPANGTKTSQWYVDGYTNRQPGMLVSYREWVAEVVARYKDDPRIALWQLSNEAEIRYVDGSGNDLGCPSGNEPADILKAWASDVSGLVKSIDANHLVSLGTLGSGQCGAQGAQYQSVHDVATIDLCEYHDYGSPLVGIPGDQYNGLQVRLDQCNALDKPIFVGEAGIIPNDVGGTLEARADAFQAKIDAQFAAGVRGFLAWAWSPNSTSSTQDSFDIGPGDLALGVLADAVDNGGVTQSPVVAISAGFAHTCALMTSGGVKCWGLNDRGQLGDGTQTDSSTPVDVSGLSSGVAAIAAGAQYTCALMTSGGVKCWGLNLFGGLGDGTLTDRHTPVDVSGLSSGVAAISTGNQYACALMISGGVKCWGFNYFGQLGRGTATIGGCNCETTPVDASSLPGGIASISSGQDHTCAITSSGGAKCWGFNPYGQLGDGTTTDRLTPVDVSGLTSGAAQISPQAYSTCAVTTSGGAKCWGSNSYGALGDGTQTNRPTPVDVSGLTSGISKIASAGDFACALTTSGGVKCWGINLNGELGDGTLASSNTTVDVSGLASGAAEISVARNGHHACALMTSGGVKCWGWNAFGQLGDGTTTNGSVPVDVVLGGVVVPSAADLQVTATVASPALAYAGNDLTYSVQVANLGPDTAAGVGLTDVLPTGAVFASVATNQGSCSYASGSVTCNLGDLSNGASATITIAVTPTIAGGNMNTATASSSTSDPVPANDESATSVDVGGQTCTIVGTQANDPSLNGTSGNDTICGLGGNDSILGGIGNDILVGGSGVDGLKGDAGNDSLFGGAGNDSLNGGTGTGDVARYDPAPAPITANLGTSAATGEGTDSMSSNSIEGLVGSAFADTLTGSNNSESLSGLAGNDSLSGGGGIDILQGGSDNDSILGGNANDQVYGQAGNDTLNGGPGTDLVRFDEAPGPITASLTNLTATGDGNDTFVANSLEGLVGSPFGDSLTGGAGADGLYGLGGNDTLSGLAGGDRVEGGVGDDSMLGGLNNDTLLGLAGDDVIDGGAGVDVASFEFASSGVTVNLTNLTATGEGADTFASNTIENLLGSPFADTLTGDGLANKLEGKDGDDFLYGVAGNDVLLGGNGNDLLAGGPGSDTLSGGPGTDSCTQDTGSPVTQC